MDPYYEQRLRDEVLYLHSLWRQGPTRAISTFTSAHSSALLLQPANSTHFKKRAKNRRPIKPQNYNNNSSSGIEWPVEPTSNSPPRWATGWPELKLKPNPNARLPSPEELARFNWTQLQQNALKAVQEFFSSNAESDDDDNADESDDDADDDVMEDDDMAEKEYKFFLSLLNEEESELKSYLEKNCGGGGDFCCLVCAGSGVKFGKRFKDCVALVQHSITIAKTKRKRAHRAYGQAVCKILGWEIDQLPSITSNLRSTELQVNAVEGNKDSTVLTSSEALVHVGNCEVVLEMDSNAGEALPDKAPDLSNDMDGELMVCETSDHVVEAVISKEVPDKQVVNEAGGNAEGVVTSLEPLKQDGVGSSCGNEVSGIRSIMYLLMAEWKTIFRIGDNVKCVCNGCEEIKGFQVS